MRSINVRTFGQSSKDGMAPSCHASSFYFPTALLCAGRSFGDRFVRLCDWSSWEKANRTQASVCAGRAGRRHFGPFQGGSSSGGAGWRLRRVERIGDCGGMRCGSACPPRSADRVAAPVGAAAARPGSAHQKKWSTPNGVSSGYRQSRRAIPRQDALAVDVGEKSWTGPERWRPPLGQQVRRGEAALRPKGRHHQTRPPGATGRLLIRPLGERYTFRSVFGAFTFSRYTFRSVFRSLFGAFFAHLSERFSVRKV